MKAKIHYSGGQRLVNVEFDLGLQSQRFVVRNIDMINMVEVRNIIMAKDRATDCLLWVGDEEVGELANLLINLPDGTKIEDEITVDLQVGSTGKSSQYKLTIDKSNDFISFLKYGDKKEYKVKKDSCECMAWRFSKASPKTCKHRDMLLMSGIQLNEPPKKIVLSKEERKEWTNAFRRAKIKDLEAKNWIIRYSQQLVEDAIALSMAEWYDYYQKVKEGTVTFKPREDD